MCILLAFGCLAARDDLRAKTLTNLDEVKASVSFSSPENDPYPALWFDTTIDRTRDCYVIFEGPERVRYQLKSLSMSELMSYPSDSLIVKTHENACGVCSTLTDLAVYIDTPDLTAPVRRCGLGAWVFLSTMQCLRDLGFTEACASIWYWNVQHTSRLGSLGGCFGVCMMHVFAPNNIEVGSHNPCRPIGSGSSGNSGSDAGRGEQRCAADYPSSSSNSIAPPDGGGPSGGFLGLTFGHSEGMCGNTINGAPACSESQWRNGPYRLNPCLQCDECRSGPIFQKVAGRTRRNSGLSSAIRRPPEAIVTVTQDGYGGPVSR